LSLGASAKDCNFAQQPWSSIVALKEVATELAPKLNEWLRPLEPRLSAPEIPERAIGGWQRALIDLLLEDYHHYNSLQYQTDLKTFVSRGQLKFALHLQLKLQLIEKHTFFMSWMVK
jgi:hypothetical protein